MHRHGQQLRTLKRRCRGNGPVGTLLGQGNVQGIVVSRGQAVHVLDARVQAGGRHELAQQDGVFARKDVVVVVRGSLRLTLLGLSNGLRLGLGNLDLLGLVAQGKHAEALGLGLKGVRVPDGQVLVAQRLDHDVGCGHERLGRGLALGVVADRQVNDLQIVNVLDLQALGDLLLLELEGHLDPTLAGLDLDGLAVLDVQEGHVKEVGVGVGVGVLLAGSLIQGLHVGIVGVHVVLVAVLVDGRHRQLCAVRHGSGVLELGSHLEVGVLVLIYGLGVCGLGFVGLGGHGDRGSGFGLVGRQGEGAIGGKGHLAAVDGDGVQLVTAVGHDGKAGGLALGHLEAAAGGGERLVAVSDGRVAQADGDGCLGGRSSCGLLFHRSGGLGLRRGRSFRRGGGFRLRRGLGLGRRGGLLHDGSCLLHGGRRLRLRCRLGLGRWGGLCLDLDGLCAVVQRIRVRDGRRLQHHADGEQHRQELVGKVPGGPLLCLTQVRDLHIYLPVPWVGSTT